MAAALVFIRRHPIAVSAVVLVVLLLALSYDPSSEGSPEEIEAAVVSDDPQMNGTQCELAGDHVSLGAIWRCDVPEYRQRGGLDECYSWDNFNGTTNETSCSYLKPENGGTSSE